MQPLELIVVSHSPAARRLLQLLLRELGHLCHPTADADDALARAELGSVGAVFVDVRGSEEDALFLVGLLQRRHPALACITLHAGSMQVRSGDCLRTVPYGTGPAGASGFPSSQDLKEAVALISADRLLQTFRPPLARA